MQSRIEPVSNLLHGIIESTRLNQTPAELRNRVTQLEERNAALEMASNTEMASNKKYMKNFEI